MTKKSPQLASQTPEGQILQLIYEMGESREAYDCLRRIKDKIADRLAKIWSRKRRPSRGRKRSAAELQAMDWRLAGMIARREEIDQAEAYRRMLARREAKARGQTTEDELPPGTYSVANWQDALRDLRAKKAAPATPAPVQPRDDEDDYRGSRIARPSGIARPMKPGGKY